ncbi:dTDP-4-dehydrorhamnose reductase [Hazenella sp. IB182353]|uniref:dTDP-4-dehydrorhamnose reductase n=1 Tax=Polycladospora coralii TaxID=2771432 RepID=UPI0017473385|nr:dTDP-4-dehydrorhamnose reductase [Polycladospora coralii]MBS7529043.1 dTDP-4-dehydrorhamnose reductase [Polycladospora coralii]
MKILVTGAKGMLGRDVLKVLGREQTHDVIGFDRLQWDVTDPIRTTDIVKQSNPDVIIHCAAYTKVDQAEQDFELACQINSEATKMLASLCADYDIRLVYISTDYVFDGKKATGYTEYDEVNPINCYGLSKRMGEEYVERICPHFLILRTSWLYGNQGNHFVRAILQKAKMGEPLSVVDDQVGSPTYTVHLAEKISDLLKTEEKGVFHTAGEGSCSWFQFATYILEQANLDVRIHAITSDDLTRAAKRPAYSILIPKRSLNANLPLLPHWKIGVEAYFDVIREGVNHD